MLDSGFFPDLNLFTSFPVLKEVTNCIVIPVKNEEKYLAQTLKSFCEQLNLDASPLLTNSFEILLLANNCTDNSVSIIKQFQQDFPKLNVYLEEITLPADQANIGFVRRILMNCAYNRLRDKCEGIILTTDGDTCVSNDWIAQTNLEIKNGADAVGGRILLYPNELSAMDENTRNTHLKDEEYQLLIAELEALVFQNSHNPLPTHHQHFNGSFAVTVDCYKKSGGIPDVIQMEDLAFFEQLQAIDAKIRKSNKVQVHTSARLIGRTEVGLSYQLNKWNTLQEQKKDILVKSADSIYQNLIIKKRFFSIWNTFKTSNYLDNDFQLILSELNLNLKIILKILNECQFFGEFYKKVSGEIPEKNSQTNIDEAIEELKLIIKQF